MKPRKKTSSKDAAKRATMTTLQKQRGHRAEDDPGKANRALGEGMGGVRSQMQLAGVLSVVLTVYLTTLHPSLPGGDAGELIVAAHELGVAHPPGYPLFTLLLKASFMLSYGSVAWTANLVTAVMATMAGGALYRAVFLLSGSVAAGWLAAGLFSFSRLTWAWSITAEVFALNNLLVALLLLAAVCFSQALPNTVSRVAQAGACVCGLCLSNQHTTVVYIAIIVPWVMSVLYANSVLSVRLVVKLSLWFVLGLLPYLYLPLSSLHGQARWTWGDQSSLSGLLTHLFRREYGTLQLLKDHEGQGFIAGLVAYMKHVGQDLTPAILCFFGVSAISIYTRWKRREHGQVMVVWVLMVSVYVTFFAWRANLDIENPLLRGVTERFWMQSDLVVIALACVTLSDFVKLMDRFVPVLKYHMDKMAVVVLVAAQLRMNFAACDQSANRVVEQFALTTLRSLPANSVVLTKGDLPSNSLRYFHMVESVRPDITLFDQELMTYKWSVSKLGGHYPDMLWPGDCLHLRSGVNKEGERQFTFRQLLDGLYDRRPIFGCIGVQDHEPSWKTAYSLRPFGMCMQFIRTDHSLLDLPHWINASHHFALNWTHPLSQSELTWEYVANAEMWRAKTSAGVYLLEAADSVRDTKEKATLLQHAYQIYAEAMESNLSFPSHWHKNFALVCEKLRHVADASETVPLLKSTIAHFKAYLQSGTFDEQTEAIQDAVDKLGNYLQTVA